MNGRRFFSDIDFPDQYYGVLVRSSIERGRLVDIKQPSMPDGYYFFSATDIPGENKISAMGTTIPVFTPYEIQYFGEPLGIIVGPDLETVHELVAEVLIETETLEPLKFSEKFPSSQVLGKRILTDGDADRVLAKAERVVESECEIGPQDHFYAEPLGVNVNVNVKTGKLEIYTATQWPFHARAAVSAVLDLDSDDIVIMPTALGESMDGKIWYPSLLAAQAALAAVMCKKPVKLSFSRQEDFLFSGKSAPVKIRYRTALGPDGNIEAMTVRALINAGAFSPLVDEIVDRMAVAAIGLYSASSYRIEIFALKTSLPPLGALNGWGEAQIFYALESHVSAIIAKLDTSPVEWKLLNLKGKGHTTVTGGEITGDFGYTELIERLCAECDFPRKYAAYGLLNGRRHNYRDGPLRGIALSIGFQGNGFVGKTYDTARYAVEASIGTDGTLRLSAGQLSPAMQGVARNIATKILGIEDASIVFVGDDTDTMTESGPRTLSSDISIIAPLIEKCCQTIQRQRFRHPLPISVKKTYKPTKGDEWKAQTMTGMPFVSITAGASIVELEMDPITYDTKIRGIWLACRPGKVMDERAALTTLRKSVPTAISKVLAESIVIKDGKLSPKDSVQYEVLPPSLIPPISVTALESDGPPKGVGAIAQNLIPSAYAAALAQITGQEIAVIPIDARHVYEAMNLTEERK